MPFHGGACNASSPGLALSAGVGEEKKDGGLFSLVGFIEEEKPEREKAAGRRKWDRWPLGSSVSSLSNGPHRTRGSEREETKGGPG